MFQEHSTEEYEIHIKRYENGKVVAGLLKTADNLDELIKNIDKLVERLRPIEGHDKEKITIEVNKDKNYKFSDLQQQLINYLTNKVIVRKVLTDNDVEIIKILFK